MKHLPVALLLVALIPVVASADVREVLQVVERDFDRDGVPDRATLMKRGSAHVLLMEHGTSQDPGAVYEIPLHPRTFPRPKLVFSESARYLTVGDPGAKRKGWVLWHRSGWVIQADSRSGIEPKAR